ncbi:chromate efflux transporter [Nocardioides sp. Kera G14]|uniref:chromate efflux transporter n=1 Tax=Nocardioides sp. Kera G14 TaxID=2884264 RepID=UPI001D12A1A0|nr:chromate efflux transporter [Nocardioides sp. Kera G14]UDY23532.1 chromate efflux transporter [Nocardioides sp. Kera G14]
MTAPGVPLATILREWGRIGVLGFGGPPTHIRMLRDTVVERRGWIDAVEFEDAIATCNLLPGPASTQLSIYTAWRLRGPAGAMTGGLAFILPGLVLILALSGLFLGDPPAWVLGAGAGAGAAVAAVAIHAGWGLTPASFSRRTSMRWFIWLVIGAAASATVGPWLVLVLLGCGVTELLIRRPTDAGPRERRGPNAVVLPLVAKVALMTGGVGVLLPLALTALKVGALSYGGGFVIVPLMQGDAVDGRGWMTQGEFLNAVALGQVTPGPVVHTVAVVGWAAAGLGGALLAAGVAFAPSFLFVLLGGRHFSALRADTRVRTFLDGAGPAAIGAIHGSAVPLARSLTDAWQWGVLAGALVLLLALRRGVVLTLVLAAAAGVLSTL